MKPPQHIPTILALLLLVIGLTSTVFLVERGGRFLTRADVDTAPKNIAISNLSPESFSVSWATPTPTRGTISYKTAGEKNNIALDDRDDNAPQKYQTHHVTLRNLEPATSYSFTIISEGTSYDNEGSPYQIQTVQALPDTTFVAPVYGAVLHSNNQPADGALVYLKIDNSQVLSTITQRNGQFVLPIAGIRDESLTQSLRVSNNSAVSLTIRGTDDTIAQVSALFQNTQPLPDIVLGKTYRFDTQSKRHLSPVSYWINTAVRLLSQSLTRPVFASSAIAILQPGQNAGVPTGSPLFRGTGIADKQVVITVGNPPQTGKVWVDKDNVWSWTPPSPLPPDTYTVTITTFDQVNDPVALSRQFMVLKSGSSVLQAATPSATPATAPTASPATTASPSAQPLPISGTTYPTFAMLFVGAALLFIGGITQGNKARM